MNTEIIQIRDITVYEGNVPALKHEIYFHGVLLTARQAEIYRRAIGKYKLTIFDPIVGAEVSKSSFDALPAFIQSLNFPRNCEFQYLESSVEVQNSSKGNSLLTFSFNFDVENWKIPLGIGDLRKEMRCIWNDQPIAEGIFHDHDLAFPQFSLRFEVTDLSVTIEAEERKRSGQVHDFLKRAYAGVVANAQENHELDAVSDTTQPLVLLIGSIESEGIKSALKAADRLYKVKRLDSKPENWSNIADYFDNYAIRCAIVKLSGSVYELLSKPEYKDVREKLFTHLSKVRHAIFIHEELYSGNYTSEQLEPNLPIVNYNDLLGLMLHRPPEEVRVEVNALLTDRELNVLVYATNAELTVVGSSFIAEAEQGLLYRIYIPSDRLWAGETDRLIQLLRDYLTRTGQVAVRLDQHRTQHGIIYEFFTDPNFIDVEDTEQSLAVQFQEFSQFLELSMSEPEQAAAFLRSKQIDSGEVAQIITRYAKEGKRIQVDMKHDREQKILSVRHRLESELVDELPLSTSSETIAALVDAVVPTSLSMISALLPQQQPLQLSAMEGSAITFNFKPQIVNAVNSAVAQEIHGDVHLTQHDKELLRFIQEHAIDREAELSLAVHELSDKSVPQSRRLAAKQRLQTFLTQVGKVTGDVAVEVLKSYVKGSIGLS